tara:strand:+ start:3926 stop:4897 length:972 start_codon:yes stop_codon:yes gene_type:complete
MATPVGAVSTYDEPIATGGNREDLSDMLWDVSPTETPFITAIGKNRSTATSHDWLTDVLEDEASNASIEGSDATFVDPASRVRLSNYTQILTKTAMVTGSQEKVLKGGGIKSEMAYQVARRMKAIKRDAEYGMVGLAQEKDGGSTAAARTMGGFLSYLSGTSFRGGAGSTAPVGNGDLTGYAPGTSRPFSETILSDSLAALWNQSGGNENILGITGSYNRGVVSTFTASSTRYVTTDDKKLVASIDVYDGDFHTVTMSPDRFTAPSVMFLVDPEYAKVSDLRPLFTRDIATVGDATRKQLVWETTLEVCNPLAHIAIAALTTS